jgi:hypothetical protein
VPALLEFKITHLHTESFLAKAIEMEPRTTKGMVSAVLQLEIVRLDLASVLGWALAQAEEPGWESAGHLGLAVSADIAMACLLVVLLLLPVEPTKAAAGSEVRHRRRD